MIAARSRNRLRGVGPVWWWPGAALGAAGASVLAGVLVARGYAAPAALLAIVGAAFLLGLRNWRWSIMGLLVYLPFSGLAIIATYPGGQGQVAALLAKDFLFVIPAYIGFVAVALGRRLRVSFPGAPTVLLGLLALLVVGQALNPTLPNLFVGLIGIKVWLLYIPLYFLAYHLVETRRDLFRVLTVMVAAGVVPLMLGALEAALIYSGRAGTVYGYYGDAAVAVTQNFAELSYGAGGALRRVPSTFSFVAQYFGFAVTMVAVGYAWWRGARGGRRDPAGVAVWLLALAAAFLTGARAVFLLVPGLVVLVVLLERRRGLPVARLLAPAGVLLGALALIGASIGAVAGQTLSIAGQYFQSLFVDGFRQAFGLTLAGLGTGIDTVGARYAYSRGELFPAVGGQWYESWWVKVQLELGVAGLVLVALLFGTILVRCFRAHRDLRDPRLKAVSAALLAFLVCITFAGVKGQYLDLDPVNVYFWLFAGLLTRIPSLDRGAPPHDPSLPLE